MNVRTRIKICGVLDLATAQVAARCGADAVGLVRVDRSPRCIDGQRAAEIASGLPPWVAAVAVYANTEPSRIVDEWHRVAVRPWIQLHGDEQEVGASLEGFRVIKALPCDAPADILRRWDDDPLVAAMLIDAPTPGSGATFDHAGFGAARSGLVNPLILAGGLTPENVGDAICSLRPWAVDVSSGVESQRGIKDPARIAEFCAAVRRADAT